MSFETVLTKANSTARPLVLKLAERYRTDVVASEVQKKHDHEVLTDSIIWSTQALASEGVLATEGTSPRMVILTRILTVLQTTEQDSPLQTALGTLLQTAEEEKEAAAQGGTEEIDAATLLRRAAAAEQRNDKRRQRNAAALAEMDDVDDTVQEL